MDEAETIAAYLAELRAQFGDDWHTQAFWLTSDDPRDARLSWHGITLYIWRDRILRAQQSAERAAAA